jgi:uncharacterized protein (TIGR00304 family)
MDIGLVIAGIFLVMIGVFMLLFFVLGSRPAKGNRSEVKAGGVIVVGPIPIIFGTDKSAFKTAAILGIILVTLTIILYIIVSSRW